MATAISHFTLPPNRRVSTTEQVGVVAFHTNDIQHVSFSINSGAATNVTTRTKVTDTDVKGKTVTHWEYQIEFDPSLYADGAVTFDVTAVPVTGTSRVLPQMTLFANSGGTLDGSVLTVNSSENPGGAGTYDTIKAALTAAASNGGDILELLQEGTYLTDDADFQLDFARTNVDYWTTIRGASGLNAHNVIMGRSVYGIARTKSDRVKYEHLTFDLDQISSTYLEDTGYGAVPNRIGDTGWLHDCYVTDALGWANPRTYQNQFFRLTSVVDGMYVTDSEAYDTTFGFAGSRFQRNCYQRRISSDAYKGDVFVLNSSLYEMVGSTRTLIDDVHADVCQCLGNQENVIFYNVEGANLIDVQGIHTDQIGSPSYDDVAFINYSMQIDDGDPVCSILGPCDHFLMYNVSIPEQALSFRELDAGGGTVFTAVDFDVRDCVFDAVTSQGGGALTGVTVNYSHSITTAIAVGWGSNNSQSAVDMAAVGILGGWEYTGAGLADITDSGEVLADVSFPDWAYSSAIVPNKGAWPQSAWGISMASLFDPTHAAVINATSLVSFDVIDANGAPYDDATDSYWTTVTTHGATAYAKETINGVTQLARQDIDEAGISYQAPATGLDPDSNAWWFMMSYDVLAAPSGSSVALFQLANDVRDSTPCFNITSQDDLQFQHWAAGAFRFTGTPINLGSQHFVIYKYNGTGTHDYYDSEYGSWRQVTAAPGSNGDTLSSFWLGTGYLAELPAAFEYFVGAVGYAPSFAELESLVADPYQVFLSEDAAATGFTNAILKNITSSIVKDITQ